MVPPSPIRGLSPLSLQLSPHGAPEGYRQLCYGEFIEPRDVFECGGWFFQRTNTLNLTGVRYNPTHCKTYRPIVRNDNPAPNPQPKGCVQEFRDKGNTPAPEKSVRCKEYLVPAPVPATPPPEKRYKLMLDLSEQEALHLHHLMRLIGGCPRSSVRAIADKILTAFPFSTKKLLSVSNHPKFKGEFTGSINCPNYESVFFAD